VGRGAMREDTASKVERYRRAANKYGEMAKQAEPEYLAAVFRKVAVRYVFMAEDELREAARRRGTGVDRATVHPPGL
jgi:hypothetical protein